MINSSFKTELSPSTNLYKFYCDENTPEVFNEPTSMENPNNRKRSITDFLTTPATPKRSSTHRNYKKTSYSVLTASERLLELQKMEQDKLKADNLKRERAEARLKAKQEKDEAKRIKADERRLQNKIKQEKKSAAIKETRKKKKQNN